MSGAAARTGSYKKKRSKQTNIIGGNGRVETRETQRNVRRQKTLNIESYRCM